MRRSLLSFFTSLAGALLLGGCGLCQPEVTDLSQPQQRYIYHNVAYKIRHHIALGDSYRAQGLLNKAKESYEAARFYDPAYPGLGEKSLAVLKAIDEQITTGYAQGIDALSKGDKIGAMRGFNQVMMADPTYRDAAKYHKELLLDPEVTALLRDKESRIREKITAERKDPEAIAQLSLDIQDLLDLHYQNPVAQTALEKAKALKAELLTYYLREGKRLYKAGRFKAATDAFRSAQVLEPTNDEATESIRKIQQHRDMVYYVNLAKNKLRRKQYDAAAKYAQKALAIDDENEEAREIMQSVALGQVDETLDEAVSLMEEGKLLEARELISRVLAGDSGNTKARALNTKIVKAIQQRLPELLDEAQKLYGQNRFQESLELFQEALQLEPDNNISLTYIKKINNRLKTIQSLQ